MPIDTGIWTAWGTGTQDEVNGTLSQTPTGTAGQYIGVVSASSYDFTNKTAVVQIKQLPSSATGVQAMLRLEIDASNAVIIGYSDNQLLMQHQIGGSTTNVDLEAWPAGTIGLKIVFDNAQNLVWFATTADGTTWTSRFSEAIPIATTALKVSILTGTYQAVGSPGTARWESTGVLVVPYEDVAGTSTGGSTTTATIQAIRYKNIVPVTGALGGSAPWALLTKRNSTLVPLLVRQVFTGVAYDVASGNAASIIPIPQAVAPGSGLIVIVDAGISPGHNGTANLAQLQLWKFTTSTLATFTFSVDTGTGTGTKSRHVYMFTTQLSPTNALASGTGLILRFITGGAQPLGEVRYTLLEIQGYWRTQFLGNSVTGVSTSSSPSTGSLSTGATGQLRIGAVGNDSANANEVFTRTTPGNWQRLNVNTDGSTGIPFVHDVLNDVAVANTSSTVAWTSTTSSPYVAAQAFINGWPVFIGTSVGTSTASGTVSKLTISYQNIPPVTSAGKATCGPQVTVVTDSFFSSSYTPSEAVETGAYELGIGFQPTAGTTGNVTGIAIYCHAAETHTLSLYHYEGGSYVLKGRKTTALGTGWQTATLDTPVACVRDNQPWIVTRWSPSWSRASGQALNAKTSPGGLLESLPTTYWGNFGTGGVAPGATYPPNFHQDYFFVDVIFESSVAGAGSPSTTKPSGAYTFDVANSLATNLKIWLAMLETSGDNVADIAGTPQNGTVTGTLTRITGPNGGQSVALTTDNNQRIALGDQPTHGLSTGQFVPFSFSMWVRFNNTDFGSKKLFSGGYFSDAPSIRVVPGYNLYYQYGGPGGVSSQASFNDPGLTANTWYHICYTDDGLDASGSIKCYVNGTALTVNAGETNYSASGKSGSWDKNGTYGAAFGAEAPFGDDWHPAAYDSLMIYERALSAGEVSSLYAQPFSLLLVGGGGGGGTTEIDKKVSLGVGASTGVATASAPTILRRRAIVATSAGAATEVGQPSNKRLVLGTKLSVGVATDVGQPARRRPLTGTSPGTSTASATIGRKKSLVVASAGAATETGDPTRRRPIVAASAGVAVSTGQPNRVKPLAAASAGIATAAGQVEKTNLFKNIAGSSAGIATSAGTPSRKRSLVSVSSTGVAVTAATPRLKRALVAASTGVGTTTASILAKRSLTVASAGSGSSAGTVRRKVALTVSTSGIATASGVIANRKTFAGQTIGVASAGAQVSAKRLLIVATAGGTTVSVNLQKRGSLIVSSAGASSSSATPSRKRQLTAINAGSGTASAVISDKRRIVSNTSAGAAVAIGSLSKVGAPTFRDLLATGAGKGTTTTAISARRRLIAASAGVTTVAVIFRHERNLTVATDGTSVTTAAATRRRPLIGTTFGWTVAAIPIISRKRPLVTSSAGVATIVSVIAVEHRLTGTSTGISTANAQIVRSRAGIIPAPSVGSSTATVNLVVKRALRSSNVVGWTLISGRPSTVSSYLFGDVYSYSIVAGSVSRRRSLVVSTAGGSSASASIRRKIYLLATSAGVAITTATPRRIRFLIASTSSGVTVAVGAASARRLIKGVFSGPILTAGIAVTTALRPTRRKTILTLSVLAGKATISAAIGRKRTIVLVPSAGRATTDAAIANTGIVVWNGSTFAVGGPDPVVLWDNTDFSISGEGEITGWKDAEDQFIPVT